MPKENDMDVLCVCAVRYCRDRETYMPDLVQEIVMRHIEELSERTLETLLLECEEERHHSSHDEKIWMDFEKSIRAEKERRAA